MKKRAVAHPEHYPDELLAFALRFLDAVESVGDLTSWLKPSAGIPGGPTLIPADFAQLAERVAQLGTGLLGGCCGTTENHIAAIHSVWDRDKPLVKRALGC